MRVRWIPVALAAGAMMIAPTAASAQAPKAKQAPRTQQPLNPELDVEELTPSQIQRAQDPEPPEAPRSTPKAPPKQAATAAAAPRAIACSGAFAKDSSHLKLATAFNSQNIVFTEVDGPDGAKVMASVLFPKDPKRRLEVWWQNEAARSDTFLIVINGQSTWTAPKGLRLGLQLAAVEKLNGKPFTLKGLDKDNGSTIGDWNGGGLAQLPGGCKVGLRLTPDPKTAPEARSAVSGNKDFASSDASMRALKPTITEIILGY